MKNRFPVLIIGLLANLLAFSQQINWQWARGSAGPGYQEGLASATDKNGNVYVTGSFPGDCIAFGNTVLYYNSPPVLSSQENLFIAKYSPAGNLLWAQGPISTDTGWIMGFGIATDENNNVFVTGSYSGDKILFKNGFLPPTKQDMNGVFILKYDSSGNELWANGAGGLLEDYGFGITTDNNGNAYITGVFESDSLVFGTSVLYRVGPVGSYNSFVAKYNGAGQALWAECPGVGDTANIDGVGMASDGSGNVYATGFFQGSSVTFGNITLQPVSVGATNVYLVKFDNAGNVLWAKQTSGMNEQVFAICADSVGNASITGGFGGSDIIFNGTQLINNSATGTDYFIAKYDPNGDVLWAHNSNGCYACLGYGVTTDKCGNLYVGGGFTTTDQYLTITIADTTINTEVALYDPIFVVTYNAAGQALCVSALASGGDDVFGISVDQSGNAYVGADFYTDKLIAGPNTLTLTGGENVYVAKFNCTACSVSGGCESLSYQLSSSNLCRGDSVIIHFTNVTDVNISPHADVTWLDSSHAALFPDTTTLFTISGYLPCGSATMQTLTLTVLGDSIKVTSDKDTICSGDSARICAASGFANYLWNTNENAICIYAHEAGDYYVTAITGVNCSATSIPVFINEYPSPSVSILVEGDTLASYGATGYQWFLNGAAINGATGPIYIAQAGGSYTLQVTDTNGCTALSSAVSITGVNNLREDANVRLFPNPNSAGSWQLEVGIELIGSTLKIYDGEGRIVFYSAISNQKSEIKISDLPSGVYFLHISSANASITKKLVKL